MKNNTTSNDTCYTIQPLTTCIDIKTERRLIASWHTSGLTDTQIRKMLMLYFGEPAWMNQQKLYDSYRFSEIATGLKFRSKEDFLDILLKSILLSGIWRRKKTWKTCLTCRKKCILEMLIIIIYIILIKRK